MPVKVDTQYIVKLKSGEKDFTQFLTKLRIVNSIHNCWPIVDLYLALDNQDIIEFDVYGQHEFLLRIWNTTETGEMQDPETEFKLLYLESDLDLPPKPEDNTGEKYTDYQKRSILVRCIPYPAVNVMTCFINRLWEEESGMKPIEFIKEILDIKGYLKDSIIIDDGMNEFKVNQLIVPPTTIKRSVDYINEKFAIYEGPLFRYCNYAGHFLMWDLYEKMQKEKDKPRFEYIKLSAQYDSDKLFWEQNKKASDKWGEIYVGHDSVETVHYPNSVFVNYGYHNLMITHPRSDLYYIIQKNGPTAIEENGIWHDNKDTKYYQQMKHRKMYSTDSVGFEELGYTAKYSPSPLSNRLGDHFKDMFSIRFALRRNVSLRYVMQCGEVCKVTVDSKHEMTPGKNYSGSYIVETSDITLDKEPTGNGGDNYDAVCFITAFRSVMSKD